MAKPRIKRVCGSCNTYDFSPPVQKLKPDTRRLNITVPFEEALKLQVAINECIIRLNRYDRATTEGKRTMLSLSVHLDRNRITIDEWP